MTKKKSMKGEIITSHNNSYMTQHPHTEWKCKYAPSPLEKSLKNKTKQINVNYSKEEEKIHKHFAGKYIEVMKFLLKAVGAEFNTVEDLPPKTVFSLGANIWNSDRFIMLL